MMIRLVRPASRAAASALLPSAPKRACAAPSLSHLFNSQCNLRINNDGASLPPPPSRCLVTTSTIAVARGQPRHVANANRARIRQSSSDAEKDGPVAADGDGGEAPSTVSGSSQHDTWVEFQRSISVTGVDTGQTLREKKLDKKSRGGKLARKWKEREAEIEAALKGVDNTQLKAGEFPDLRYSDKETERLLAEAYAAIPPRAGKRGTLNLKRQKRRWALKRKYDAKKKEERIAAYERKLEKEARIKREIKEVRVGATEIRKRDVEYHNMVLQRWAEMNGHNAPLKEVEEPRKEELASVGWKV
ncbi:hypothetical protein ACHAWF_016208 [Thalassiosira exigua]